MPCSTSVVLATLHEDHVGSGLNSTRKIVLLFICGKASKLLHIFINIHDLHILKNGSGKKTVTFSVYLTKPLLPVMM